MTTKRRINYNLMNALYIGDLPEDVTEAKLYEVFRQAGEVASVRLCRDAETSRSRGYAFVNYHNAEDANRAFNYLNFNRMKGREMRLMRSQPDSSLRKSGKGNIFVKNLDNSIDNKSLYDTFSVFGHILSCKVAYDSDGKSRRYGFVHYENPEDAENAIKKVNGMEIAQCVVQVSPFVSSKERNGGIHRFTNLYVKNFPEGLFADEPAFRAFFERVGEVTSTHLPLRPDNSPVGFGFVNFKEPAKAREAIEQLHGYQQDGQTRSLYVAKALTKAQRRDALQRQFAEWRKKMDQETMGRNVFVKNLPENVTSEVLRVEFGAFGEVESAKVQLDDRGMSKGFGFVLYRSKEAASEAIKHMHGKTWLNKVLVVAMWQRKSVRQHQLELQMQESQKALQTAGYNASYYAPQQPMYYSPVVYAHQQQRWNAGVHGRQMVPPQAVQRQQQQQQQQQLYQQQARQNILMHSHQQAPQTAHQTAHQMYPSGGESLRARPQGAPPQPQEPTGKESQYGDLIYERLRKFKVKEIGKVTGMFLQMDEETLDQVLHNEELFSNHLNRAYQILEKGPEE